MSAMQDQDAQLLSLPALAEVLKLPTRWIRAEADAGNIPHLKVGNRYRFNRNAVLEVLAKRAAQAGKAVPRGR
jgi:excisionase family DNA binding protein